ncbi:MAG: hypothetical protein QXI93_01945 [Candidatus Methanomethylicia archaeon]
MSTSIEFSVSTIIFLFALIFSLNNFIITGDLIRRSIMDSYEASFIKSILLPMIFGDWKIELKFNSAGVSEMDLSLKDYGFEGDFKILIIPIKIFNKGVEGLDKSRVYSSIFLNFHGEIYFIIVLRCDS